jgi:hypothetical protein
MLVGRVTLGKEAEEGDGRGAVSLVKSLWR